MNASDQTHALMEPETIELLKKRAREVRARNSSMQFREVFHEVIVVRRGKSVLGLPIDAVREIRLVHPVALPHRTPFIQSLYQVRGKVQCLVDLQPFFDAPSDFPGNEGVAAAIVSNHKGEIGIRIDEVIGPRVVYLDEKDEGLVERSKAFVSAVTRDLLIIIHIDFLFEQPEIQLGSAATGIRS
jgi:chemotaxis signal transduction protein